MAVISFIEIGKEQRKSLDDKIQTAVSVIGQGFSVCKSRPSLAFSGGKDSTVLWHLIRTNFPEWNDRLAIIFANTGVEYPESLSFARSLGREWGSDNFYEATPERLDKDGLKYAAQRQVLAWLVETGGISSVLREDGKLRSTDALERACPAFLWDKFVAEKLVWKEGTPKSYWWCVDQYGYPILGKEFSELNARRINIDCFLRFSESKSTDEKRMAYYRILDKVKISQACCHQLKKKPNERLEKELKIDVCFLGLMASESYRRKKLFASRGYLYEMATKYHLNKIPFYHCNPLSTWTDDDIWEYIRRFDVPYSSLYDLEYVDEDGAVCKMRRNGCVGCFTDYGRKSNHMYVLRQTHPSRWKGIMRYGMGEQIQKLKREGLKSGANNFLAAISAFSDDEYAEGIKWAIENRPCAFD